MILCKTFNVERGLFITPSKIRPQTSVSLHVERRNLKLGTFFRRIGRKIISSNVKLIEKREEDWSKEYLANVAQSIDNKLIETESSQSSFIGQIN